MIESILTSATRIGTFAGEQPLTNASGFFFERDGRLFVVTSRHVVIDEPSEHRPDRITIVLHTDPENIAETVGFSIPLYRDGMSLWRQGQDSAGGIDVALIELDRSALPETAVFECFTPEHLLGPEESVEIGTPILVLGFPLGFQDWLHHVPVVRQAVVASSFGLRFQGEGFFLTDARTHRGSSGAPVILRDSDPLEATASLPWRLLGVHSSRLDVGGREVGEDEALGLNLLTLTED
jgi:hypothetical protein